MADTQQVVRAAMEHFRAARFDAAAGLLLRALQRDPAHPGANQLHALTMLALNKTDAALYYMGRAIEAQPLHGEFHANLGLIMSSTPDKAGAEAAFRRAIELEPSHADAAARLGHLLAERGAQDEAADVLRAAMQADPLSIQAASSMAKVLSDTGRTEEAVALLKDALPRASAGGKPTDAGALSLLCLLSNYVEEDPSKVLQTHRLFGSFTDQAVPVDKRLPAGNLRQPREDRVRIGYLSPDLRRHSVTSFLEPLLASHDRSRFEVFVYSLGSHVDEVTRRLESHVEHWRATGPRQNDAVLESIRRDKLDVLIELSGHTMHNRLTMLARRAAPVQATFLGYPATTGCPCIDVRLVDSITDPKGADLYATERLIRLPGCFLCFRPPDEAPEVTLRGDGPVVFGSFNNPAKISEATVDLWSRVLSTIPGSRLVLKGSALGLTTVQDQLAARFGHRGVQRSRIDMTGFMADPRDHLGAYGGIDIGLDPTPYNGTTTTCEAMWMGVPVVTFAGKTHAARVGASLLTAAGVPELIGNTAEDFVATAAALANDHPRRSELRRTLRGRIANSALCDGVAYTGSFERMLADLARRPLGPA